MYTYVNPCLPLMVVFEMGRHVDMVRMVGLVRMVRWVRSVRFW